MKLNQLQLFRFKKMIKPVLTNVKTLNEASKVSSFLQDAGWKGKAVNGKPTNMHFLFFGGFGRFVYHLKEKWQTVTLFLAGSGNQQLSHFSHTCSLDGVVLQRIGRGPQSGEVCHLFD